MHSHQYTHSVANIINTCVLILSVTPKHSFQINERFTTFLSPHSPEFPDFLVTFSFFPFPGYIIPSPHLFLWFPLSICHLEQFHLSGLSHPCSLYSLPHSASKMAFFVRNQFFQACRIINHTFLYITYDLVYNCVCAGGSGAHMQVCEHLYVTLLMT